MKKSYILNPKSSPPSWRRPAFNLLTFAPRCQIAPRSARKGQACCLFLKIRSHRNGRVLCSGNTRGLFCSFRFIHTKLLEDTLILVNHHQHQNNNHHPIHSHYPRGGYFPDSHVRKVMGYSIRTQEWRLFLFVMVESGFHMIGERICKKGTLSGLGSPMKGTTIIFLTGKHKRWLSKSSSSTTTTTTKHQTNPKRYL